MRSFPMPCSKSREFSYLPSSAEETFWDDHIIESLRAYDFDTPKKPLPVDAFSDQIVDVVKRHDIVIIKGHTGCGKTTRVPFTLLKSTGNCNIIVSQPRRLATMAAAQRISNENNWNLGEVVGYQIGLDVNADENTRLTFCTTQILLQKLGNDQHYTHIILDEVHEREKYLDVIMSVLRERFHDRAYTTKLILMSATGDTDRLARYFSRIRNNIPVISVGVQSLYIVKEYYLEHVLDVINDRGKDYELDFDIEYPALCKSNYTRAMRLLHYFENEEMLELFERNKGRGLSLEKIQNAVRPAVLIFLPGLYEILMMEKLIRSDARHKYARGLWKDSYLNWDIVMLHSSISMEEQQNAFRKSPPGYRKIILSTNISESSLTIIGVKYVIDFCLTKQLACGFDRNYYVLEMNWAAKDNLMQRKGRVGRLSDGMLYRLIPRNFYKDLDQFEIPEICRTQLSQLVLIIKEIGLGHPLEVFTRTLDPPTKEHLAMEILHLKQIGALEQLFRGNFDSLNGDLTDMGRFISKLPVDVNMGKLVYLGYIFGTLVEAVTIAATSAVSSIFTGFHIKPMEEYERRLRWVEKKLPSDYFVFLRVFHAFESAIFNTKGDQYNWCRDKGVSLSHLLTIKYTRDEILTRVKRMLPPYNGTCDDTAEFNNLYLATVFAGASYPAYFTRQYSISMEQAKRDLKGNDPFNTVYLNGIPFGQPPQIYAVDIKEQFSSITNNVKFDYTPGNIYLTFPEERQENKFCEDVFYALYKGILMRREIPLAVMDVNDAKEYADKYKGKEYIPSPPENLRMEEVYLTGPKSPLEFDICTTTSGWAYRKAFISHTSVNAVILDDDPDDPTERLLVAGRVRSHRNYDTLQLDMTTYYPRLPGLTAIYYMMFSPDVYLKMNENKTRYVEALCGVDLDEMIVKDEWDLDVARCVNITFDTTFSDEDITLMNKIRGILNETFSDSNTPNMDIYRRRLRVYVKELLYNKRSIQCVQKSFMTEKWKTTMQFESRRAAEKGSLFFPIHREELLVSDEFVRKVVFQNVQKMKELVLGLKSEFLITCITCEETFTNHMDLRLHVLSKGHEMRLRGYNIASGRNELLKELEMFVWNEKKVGNEIKLPLAQRHIFHHLREENYD